VKLEDSIEAISATQRRRELDLWVLRSCISSRNSNMGISNERLRQ
jgi:hypothetical protein